MGYDLGHFGNDFTDTLDVMPCYQVFGPFQILKLTFWTIDNVHRIIFFSKSEINSKKSQNIYIRKVVDNNETFPKI
jgi:hypothetical protein